ncbi:hypothetical protein EON65_51945 [archaeon]|nr:MAG: hypothetical protein EON65_51945 [archaeon]
MGGGQGRVKDVKEHHELLLKWRDEVGDLRMTSDLFDTKLFSKRFTHMMQALMDVYYVNTYKLARTPGYTKKKYHIFASKARVANKKHLTPVYQQYDRGSIYFPSRYIVGQVAGPITIPTENYHKGCLLQETWPELPPEVFDGRLIYLNIGGIVPAKGWLNVNLKVSLLLG